MQPIPRKKQTNNRSLCLPVSISYHLNNAGQMAVLHDMGHDPSYSRPSLSYNQLSIKEQVEGKGFGKRLWTYFRLCNYKPKSSQLSHAYLIPLYLLALQPFIQVNEFLQKGQNAKMRSTLRNMGYSA
jgi:hypothetical protein